MKLAIMQPAFIPPASYFRLFAAADIFVIYDDVQFNRRWYTHRQKLTDRTGRKQWLTLPIKKMDRDSTRIMDLEWSPDAHSIWEEQLFKFLLFWRVENYFVEDVRSAVDYKTPVSFVVESLELACKILNITKPIMHASNLNIPSNIKGQKRIIEICKKLMATEYINSPGGKVLYDAEAFRREGIDLKFLPDYKGSNVSILERLSSEDPRIIAREIHDNL